MNKLIDWLSDKALAWFVAFLLIFIPLYPKLPLLGVSHTWVYIRIEDVFIALTVLVWAVLWFKRKVKLPETISIPIFIYWGVGLVSTIFAIVFLFPGLANVFPNVALLHFLRRIEYLILLFVAFSTIKKPADINKYIVAVAFATFGVILYGAGQKFLGLPAFLTMNEEFAKGIPLILPHGARITSTFGGHYDLAAYLVIVISLLFSLSLGVKKIWIKVVLGVLSLLSVIVLLFTASRVSFAVYLLSVIFMLILSKKKILIIPVIIVSLVLLAQVRGTAERFAKTFRIQPIVINTRTGQPIAVLESLPPEISGLKPTPTPQVDTLPLGTGFIGIPPVSEQPQVTTVAVIRKSVSESLKVATISSEISTISGSFLIQKAFVYDISFTTRFQGEWPRAWAAFQKSIFLGTGYSSITLATDNDYLRMVGETGILGLLSFLFIFSTYSLLLVKNLNRIESPVEKSFVIGVTAGIFGLFLNALLIDVFEASKVAQEIWLLTGLSVGILALYAKGKIDLFKETLRMITSVPAIFLYLFLVAIFLYAKILPSYFTGDDFTWLRWAAESKLSTLADNFSDAGGFFYRPLTKFLYFLIYSVFWLKPLGYRMVSIGLYYGISIFVYLVSAKLTGRKILAFCSALLFLTLPINHESVSWVSAYSGMMSALLILASFYFFLTAEGKYKWTKILLVVLLFPLGLLSYEGSTALPFLVIWASLIQYGKKIVKDREKIITIGVLLLELISYFYLRNLAHAQGMSGDYAFNLSNLPFNVPGNLLGYLATFMFGTIAIPYYDFLRQALRQEKIVALAISVVGIFAVFAFRKFFRNPNKIYILLAGLFVFSLLPYLGLGNIAERYGLLASTFGVILLVKMVFDYCEKLLGDSRRSLLVFVAMVAVLFFVYRSQLNTLLSDWYKAADTGKKIIYSLKDNYKSFVPKTTLLFADIPIRYHRAWIFPTGLEDAIWFVYRDNSLIIKVLPAGEKLPDKDISDTYRFQYENNALNIVTEKTIEKSL